MIRQITAIPTWLISTGRDVTRVYRSRLIEISSSENLKQFQQLAYQRIGVEFPLSFLNASKTYALFNRHGVMCGGFCFALGSNSRVVQSLPEESKKKLLQNVGNIEENLFEGTALWMSRYQRCKLLGVYFYLAMYWKSIMMNRSHYIYAYSSSKPKLGELYSTINPKKLFVGYTKVLPGMSEPDHEVIEFGKMSDVHRSLPKIVAFLLKRMFIARSIKKFKTYKV